MKEFSKDQLKSLVHHLRHLSEDPKEQHQSTELHWDLIRFLEATYFEPMTFEDWVEAHQTYLPVFSVDTEDLPLIINEEDEEGRFAPIISWRLSNGI